MLNILSKYGFGYQHAHNASLSSTMFCEAHGAGQLKLSKHKRLAYIRDAEPGAVIPRENLKQTVKAVDPEQNKR